MTEQEIYQKYAQAVLENPDDLLLRLHYAKLLGQQGKQQAAELQWEA